MSRALVIFGVLALCAASPSFASDLEDLVEAERGFAKAATTDGMRDAFLAVLSEDAVLFRPDPVSGRDWFEANPPPPGVLAWEPVHAEVSKAGDLGYTTGPWRYDLKSRERSNGVLIYDDGSFRQKADGSDLRRQLEGAQRCTTSGNITVCK